MSAPVLRSVAPVFWVRDVERSIAFYESVLGFGVGWRWGTPTAVASVCRDDVELMLELPGKSDTPAPSRVYVSMVGLDGYYAGLVAAGVTIVHPLATRDYGMRDCRIADPDGNELSFGEPVA